MTDEEGWLDAGDGQRVFWRTSGNPDGKPLLVLHGGPGGGMPKDFGEPVDQQRYRIVRFDQRNCGRSTPHAADPGTDLSWNTTDQLLRDIEMLREHLGIERWVVFGSSWGSALALAYAEQHPDRVTGLILLLFWQMGRVEVDWLYRGGLSIVFPEQWQQFIDILPVHERVNPPAGYARLLTHPDREQRMRAATGWAAWEDAALSLEPAGRRNHYRREQDDALLAFARICAHYAAHDGWLEPGALLRDAHRLAGIPGVIIHGRHDLSCPLGPAWTFAQAWPEGELVVLDDAGHQGTPSMGKEIGLALERFA